MDESEITGQIRTRMRLRILMTSSIVLFVGAVAYPLSSGPVIYLAHMFAASCDVREPVEAVYAPVLSIADVVRADWPVNQYLAIFKSTGALRNRHAVTRLTHARKLVAAGKLDQAEHLAKRVQQWDCWYGLFDDRPELVIGEISRHRTTSSP